MENIDTKIQRLQNEVDYEKMMPPGNCVKIASKQMDLYRLYVSNGDQENARKTLEDARAVLTNPDCPPSRQQRMLLNQLMPLLGPQANQVGNYGLQRMRMPIYIRYNGLIFLGVGYLLLYLFTYFGLITYEEYNIAIYVVFALSWVFSFTLIRLYARRYRRR